MAITMKKEYTMDESLALLEKLLPPSKFAVLKPLVEDGTVKVKTQFFNLAFYFGNKQVVGANLPKSVPALQSIAKDSPDLALSQKVAEGLFNEMIADMKKAEKSKAIPDVSIPYKPPVGETYVTKGGVKKKTLEQIAEEAKVKAAAKQAAYAEAYGVPPKKPVPFIGKGSKVRLKDAMALNQPVHATSPDTTYYVAAISERVKIAVRNRVVAGKISIRAEGKPNLAEKKALIDAGMTQQHNDLGDYYSMHLDTTSPNGKVPHGRVIGSFLMGLGIEFDQQITSVNKLTSE